LDSWRLVRDRPKHRLLDLTRLLSRAGRRLTGVDRVEFAYLRRFLSDAEPVHGLIATSLGFLLLDRSGMSAVQSALISGFWGKRGLVSRLSLKLDPTRQAALSLARYHAVDRCRLHGIAAMLARHAPDGVDYYNVGHSNLSLPTLLEVGQLTGSRRNVLIHDTIPLDFPQYQRPETVAGFRRKLGAALAQSDRIICNSYETRAGIARHAAPHSPGPAMIVAHLGVDLATPDPAALPSGLPLDRPYFVTLGTIEPRKNHVLLLNIWDRFASDENAPHLFICGNRGWRNEEIFARLDRGISHVVELPGLSDAAIAALLRGARAMLFPSFAEGFGLPPVEAAALGVPVICGNLAIYREVLGDTPVYLDPTDGYLWEKYIRSLTAKLSRPEPITPPNWEAHFKIVLSID